MALTQDEYLKTKAQAYEPALANDRARKLAALKQAYESNTQSFDNSKATVNEDYSLGLNSVNTERDRTMPMFQLQRNQADAGTDSRIQALRNSLANVGKYRSGTAVSETAYARNLGETQKGAATTQENQFTAGIADKIGNLERSKATQLGDIQTKLALLGQQYNDSTLGAESDYTSGMQQGRGQAMNAWEQYQQQVADNLFREQQFAQQKAEADRNYQIQQQQLAISRASAARAASGGGGVKPPTKAQLTSDAYTWVKQLSATGTPLSGALSTFNSNRSTFERDGINPDDIEDQIYRTYVGMGKSEYEAAIKANAASMADGGTNGIVSNPYGYDAYGGM